MGVNLNSKTDWFLGSENTVDFSKCNQTTWSKTESIKNIVDHVKKADAIILPSGELVKRRVWKTGFEDCLSWSCQNNKKTEIIMQAYEEAFKDYRESVKKR